MPRPEPASVGVAIIARDAAATIGPCLDSVRPYVSQLIVCVDQLTTDRTRKVARQHGATCFPVKVSDWHECPRHGRVLAQHFSQARQASFAHLDPSLDFWLWIDADDVLEGAEALPELCRSVPEDTAGVWWPYEYAAVTREDGQRRVNTLFHRERLLRTHMGDAPITWTWQGRVHETVSPSVQAPWMVFDEIRVVHQPGTHDTPSSAARNLLLLEIDYEEDDSSPRTIFYLGNQHFAMGNWQAAVDWYELLCSGLGQNPYELWQAYLYMSLAYERLGNTTDAARAAYGAMDVVPQHPEPYFRLGTIANLTGEPDKAIFWNNLGRRMQKPPFFVFKNPLDYSFNQMVIQGEALMQLGRVTEARKEWEQAAEVFVDDRLALAINEARKRERLMKAAQSFVDLAGVIGVFAKVEASVAYMPMPIELGGVDISHLLEMDAANGHHDRLMDLYGMLPDDVKAFGRTRDVVMPAIVKGRASTQPRIVFWCGMSWEPWGPPSLNTTGIGGSETAVIEIAKRFAQDGWMVDVYNGADRYEGVYEGAGYWDTKRFVAGCDVFVCWRSPTTGISGDARRNILWCHDLNYGPSAAEGMRQWDQVLGVSAWHAKMLNRYYGIDSDYVPNGIDLERFSGTREKIPFRCVYASSPDRGLQTLLHFWPEVVRAEPTAELHVAYGWETIDKMIASGQRPGLAEFKDQMAKLIESTPRVVWRGRLGQGDLAQLYSESYAWLYPTDFLEVSCISAMEAMAGGAVPVATATGALPETVGTAGLLVPGPTTSRAYLSTYLPVTMAVLTELYTRKGYETAGRARAKELTWDKAYERWKEMIARTLEGSATEIHRQLAAIT